MNRTLMMAIVNMAAFLELSGEDVVRTDAAVSELDLLSGTLEGLTKEEKGQFVEFLKEQIIKEERGATRPDYLRFLGSFIEDFTDSDGAD